jgi:hypothetical protein
MTNGQETMLKGRTERNVSSNLEHLKSSTLEPRPSRTWIKFFAVGRFTFLVLSGTPKKVRSIAWFLSETLRSDLSAQVFQEFSHYSNP